MYDTPSHENVEEVIVTSDMIRKGIENVYGDESLRKRA